MGSPSSTVPNGNVTRSKLVCVGCDGTCCGETTGTRTNIQMLAEAMAGYKLDGEFDPDGSYAKFKRDDGHLLVEGVYFRGMGLSGSFEDYLTNGALADDIKQACVDAYTYIVNHYNANSRIVLFGLSRGAFTVRSVAGMINNWGILDKSKLKLGTDPEEQQKCLRLYVEGVYYNFRSSDPRYAPNEEYATGFRREFSHAYSDEPPIQFMGLLDTVGALGVPKLNPGISYSYEFYDDIIPSEVEVCYQALSTHDRLSFFQPCFARRTHPNKREATKKKQASDPKHVSTPKDNWPEPITVEVWHPGAHYDIGHQRFVFPRSHIPLTSWQAYLESFVGFLSDKFNILGLNVEPTREYSKGVLSWMMLAMRQHVPGVFANQDVAVTVAGFYGGRPVKPGWFYLRPSHSKNAYDILTTGMLGVFAKYLSPVFKMALVDRNIPQYQHATFYSSTGADDPPSYDYFSKDHQASRSGQISKAYDTYDALRSPKEILWSEGDDDLRPGKGPGAQSGRAGFPTSFKRQT